MMVKLYGYGSNNNHQLGLEHNKNVDTPTLIGLFNNIKYFNCLNKQVIIYQSNGNLFGFGENALLSTWIR